MRWLLDIHVLVWSQEAPANLGPRTRRGLLDPVNEILVSAASTLEIARLIHLGHIALAVGFEVWLSTAIDSLQARSLIIDHRIAQEAYALPGAFHKDPCDRLLVATARIEGATLVTADELILNYPHVQSVDARQ